MCDIPVIRRTEFKKERAAARAAACPPHLDKKLPAPPFRAQPDFRRAPNQFGVLCPAGINRIATALWRCS
jgi:hypothetical protein